ncbi:hypothetical protein, partial [Moorena sp. SIO3H5]|uniref:hypothetical protein n=1 Tax=Moorena sp. SIO3H5 TaxID=2607834 RepID=UPI0025F90CFA
GCGGQSRVSCHWGLVESLNTINWLLYFRLPKDANPSYSTIRRTLLRVEYPMYSACLSRFFGVQPGDETLE